MRNPSGLLKRLALMFVLVTALFVIGSCAMTPQDRVVDNTNLSSDPSQTFETVITPTAAPSPTPDYSAVSAAPTATPGSVDWSGWTFGNDTPTDPPVVTSDPSAQVTQPGTTITQPPSGQTAVPGSSTITSAPQQSITATPGTAGSGTTVTKAPSSTVTKAPSATATPTPAASSLKRGSTGSSVKKLQQRLKDLGYYTGSVDGTFGEATENAVIAFQKANGLTVDGKAGVNTQKKLYSSSAKKASSSNTTATSTPKTTKASSSSTVSPAATAVPSTKYTGGKTDIYLKLGDSGSNVKYMQNRLIELGYLTGTADGKFGETTEAAVIAFQKRNDIWHDGVAGPSTLSLMYSSSAKRASSPAGTLGSLRPGYSGAAVRTLQTNLKKLGYYKGSIDGDYGDGTTTAVMNFQIDSGLTADGIAGEATLNAIASALNGSSGSGSGSSSSSTDPKVYGQTASSNGYSTICASSGSSATKIKNLQSALSSLGMYSGSISGTYDTATKNAVTKYQKSRGLRATGMAGPCTQRLLYGGTKESGSYTKLESGSTGTKVKQLQYALYELKYYDGNITGTYDVATESAVMEFQEQNGLDIDGVAGTDTQRRLFSSYAQPCE